MVHAVSEVMEYCKIPMAHAVSKLMDYRKLPAVQAVSRQLCVPLCMLVALPVLGGDEWTLERSSGDVKVFSKRTEGFPLKEFRGECEVPASLGTLKSLMMDYNNYQKWFALSRRITLLSSASPTGFTVNYVVASPWPIADREADVAVTVNFDEGAGRGTVTLDAIQSGEKTGRNGLVRITDMHGTFRFTRVDSGRTKVVLTMRVDPRIDMAARFQNDFLRSYPLDTLRCLRKAVLSH
ncbi:MAG: hypothetical protein KA369_10625 [Spirochaetes bacterium]|nr:hypothetical protein [Spirochaetota bacterium]